MVSADERDGLDEANECPPCPAHRNIRCMPTHLFMKLVPYSFIPALSAAEQTAVWTAAVAHHRARSHGPGLAALAASPPAIATHSDGPMQGRLLLERLEGGRVALIT